MNSFTFKLSLFLGGISNWLYKRALRKYIAKQTKLMDKDLGILPTEKK